MKSLILVFFALFLQSQAHAAFVQCSLQVDACNADGDHYFCVMFGWANGKFCSATDVSRLPGRPPGNSPPKPKPNNHMYYCESLGEYLPFWSFCPPECAVGQNYCFSTGECLPETTHCPPP